MSSLRAKLAAFPLALTIACVALPSDRLGAQAPESEVAAVLESFYGAIRKGDAAAAMRLIAADAIFIESGFLETRDEYETNHLPRDIEFEREITGKREPLRIRVQGDTAWVVANTVYEGKFQDFSVSFVSVQLMVLTRAAGEWRIRAIHWSSRDV